MEYPRIYALETTNHCNSKCSWCPHQQMTREKKFVDRDTVLSVIRYMEDIEQEYIALHHMGEPLLHPVLDIIIDLFNMRYRRVELSTNGLLLPKKGKMLLESCPARVRIAVDFFYKKEGYIEGIKNFLNLAKDYPDTEIHVHTVAGNDLSIFEGYTSNILLENKVFDNWAGAVEGESKLSKSNECYFLRDNYVVVMCDGRVIPCCMDYNGDHVLGTIDDIENLGKRKPCKLCKKCAKMQFAEGGEWLTDEQEIAEIEAYEEMLKQSGEDHKYNNLGG